ncbi:MAG: hypothetical protein ABFS02_00850 [Pseudomonadota bacterium]
MANNVTQVLKTLEALQRAEPEGFQSKAPAVLLDALKAIPAGHPAHAALIAAHEHLLDDGDVEACLAELREAAQGES